MTETHAAAVPEPVPRRDRQPDRDRAAARETEGDTAAGVPAIELAGVSKDFHVHGEVVSAVKGIDLAIREGEFFSMLGPSGCGKTTTMRMIAGFEECTSGSVLLYGKDVTGVPPNRRDVNMVFQSYALFPHMNVFENVAFGLRRRRIPASEISRRVREMLGIVDLGGREKRRPRELSGGQQQRVALARALVNRPRALLLDEPLGALDLKLRQEMQIELKQIQKEVGITFVYVTHDQEEALTMSDRMAVMSNGQIEQIGPPVEVYEQPATEFVAGFIGISNVLRRDGVRFVIRPEKIRMLAAGEQAEPGMTVEQGQVEEVIYIGVSTRYLVRLDRGEQLVAVRQNMDALGDAQKFEGRPVRLAWTPDQTYVLDNGR